MNEEALRAFADSLLYDHDTTTPAEWCAANVSFDEAKYRGPFETRRREYIIRPLNYFGDRTITDVTLCCGSQIGKTGILMGGVSYLIRRKPCAIVWATANISLARTFSKQRLQPMLRKSLGDLIPRSELRNGFTALAMQIGAASINITGSNSPTNLASNPADVTIADEVDKFDEGGRGEADALNLLEQRCKDATFPQRWKTSTPTLDSGLIWTKFQDGDRQRYYMPCPTCGKFVVLAWSKKMTAFRLTGDEAFVTWDKSAKDARGKWKFDEVEKSAHAKCPHCYGEIRDGHKTKMIRGGEWRESNPGAARSFKSMHLPSMYSTATEANFGKLAVKFLNAWENMSVQGFVNGELAEPYMSQESEEERIEVVTAGSGVEVTAEWRKLLTADCQRRAPWFWHVARAWNGRDSQAFSAGPLNSWEELRAVQKQHNIPDVQVAVDSGYGAKDDAEVYKNCARFGDFIDIPMTGQCQFVGWIPTKGMPSRKRWADSETGQLRPWHLAEVDPFDDTAERGVCKMPLLEFAADFFKDILARHKAQENGIKWTVTESVSTDEYWKQVNAWIRREVKSNVSTKKEWRWVPKSTRSQDHLGDCEVLQLMLASFHSIFKL